MVSFWEVLFQTPMWIPETTDTGTPFLKIGKFLHHSYSCVAR